MPLPESFLEHLRTYGYSPRSDRHSNALALAVLEDLLAVCAPMRREAAAGNLVYALNMDLRVGTSTWNVDFVLGVPGSSIPPVPPDRISRQVPASVQLAMEIKGVMTEHRKAVKNRKRDLEAHHEHVHNYSRRTIAAAMMVVNASLRFKSPLRPQITTHGMRPQVDALVAHCVTEMRNVTGAGGVAGYGMDAKSLVVLDMENVPPYQASYWQAPPAPQPGDPLHYDSFIRRLCEEYTARFS